MRDGRLGPPELRGLGMFYAPEACIYIELHVEEDPPMATFPEVGDKAPDFTLPRTPQEQYALSDLLEKGNVVLCFYVLDFTSP